MSGVGGVCGNLCGMKVIVLRNVISLNSVMIRNVVC